MAASQNGGLVHQQLIPADSITASYDNEAKLLILKASGTHVDLTRDIEFRRLPFDGGLLFELIGWVGPVVHGESPYEITDSFNIDLPSIVFPSNTVVVNTENKQHWVVPIQYNKTTGQAATNGKAEVELPEVEQVSGDQKIVVLADEPFTIQQSDSFTGKGGSASIDFDKSFLTLTDARIEGGKIVWTFTAQQTGTTEVFVYVGQTQPPFLYRIPYVVESVVLDDKSVPTQTTASFSVNNNGQGSSGTYGAASNGRKNGNQKVGLPLSWDGFINVGLSLIKKQYPHANLLEVDATPLTRKPVQNEWGLVNNRIVCGLSGNKTAIIQSTGWGEFGKVQTINSPFLGDQVIPWPVTLDIHDAFTILRKAGYKQAIYAVTLRQPLYPGDDQPFYIFNTGTEFIAVGTKDKKIHNFGVSEYNVQKA
ncbi:hypothetical protein FOCG_13011 [Fusarium oxysporum f. sp. radicis-lycopersici 26381]|uniref:Uncharacterized protein n=4 Tax=Fusarium oxysporum TaxID=5507 RepID=A0A420RKW3_FUSOX|nr:uncharacterized protein FOBCDRAFT_190813 [Fusarium oxysporum Fo47]EWZ86066.1 hypothetical protein FOWG_11134 [Fusarium oxysporum f. sp. lycopersici MN25]EXL45634.1 hypothetical protein FOCG_13011 [Fusarium oxysporum f. sp. radicis-lycopersici 26381]KAF5262867.1 hypothetical protein FOXYS1_6405 [Fusarium oxysporum]PCD26736.1 hypothetical protein AU210_013158 [Fusarium oxysporum f. sp. radicis-cucumerinum]RKK12388.1 hypothetical protein BFJ65_g14247 [Fusarium oxysporum f. sp. cepae]